MAQPTTERLKSGDLLRLDPASGALHTRSFHLRVISGPDQGKHHTLQGTLFVGTSEDADFQLEDRSVSRYHLELRVVPQGVEIKDLGSTNGTFVAGARIQTITARKLLFFAGQTGLELSEVEEQLGPADVSATSFGRAVGESLLMRRLFGALARVAPTDAPVILLGETGVGKEVIARSLHEHSTRSEHPFVVLDCSTISANLSESQLFGHVRGAFTGASRSHAGAFLQAGKGTLFLDEVAELPPDIQPKLLRALETQKIQRLGSGELLEASCRVIAATRRDLVEEVRLGRFRQDLYFRLAVVELTVPPLRERVTDIPLLIQAFLREAQRTDFFPSPALLAELVAHDWPGNVRELRNVVERALSGADVSPLVRGGAPSTGGNLTQELLPFKEAKEQLLTAFAREYLQTLLQRTQNNVSESARLAGLSRAHFHELLHRFGIRAPSGD